MNNILNKPYHLFGGKVYLLYICNMKLKSKIFQSSCEQDLENQVQEFSESVYVISGHNFVNIHTGLYTHTLNYYDNESLIVFDELYNKFLRIGRN